MKVFDGIKHSVFCACGRCANTNDSPEFRYGMQYKSGPRMFKVEYVERDGFGWKVYRSINGQTDNLMPVSLGEFNLQAKIWNENKSSTGVLRREDI